MWAATEGIHPRGGHGPLEVASMRVRTWGPKTLENYLTALFDRAPALAMTEISMNIPFLSPADPFGAGSGARSALRRAQRGLR